MGVAMKRVVWLAALLFAACGDDANSQTPDAAVVVDASTVDAPDLRTQSLELAGAANGLHWDATAKTLYLTDSNANALLRYTDAKGIERVTALPVLASGSNPGAIARQADGTLVTPNFAMGTSDGNTLFVIDPAAKTSKALTGLDGSHRRIGLDIAPGGAIYATYFTGNGAGNQTGMVAKVAINSDGTATETDLVFATAPGFKKLVGLVATADALYVSDQTQLKVFKIALADNAVSTVGAVTSADLLAPLPNGDLLVGGKGVHRLSLAGAVTELFTGETFDAVHGLAYDAAGKRVFFINHSATVGTKDRLEVRPLE